MLKILQFLLRNSNNSNKKISVPTTKDIAEVCLNWMKNSAKMEEEVSSSAGIISGTTRNSSKPASENNHTVIYRIKAPPRKLSIKYSIPSKVCPPTDPSKNYNITSKSPRTPTSPTSTKTPYSPIPSSDNKTVSPSVSSQFLCAKNANLEIWISTKMEKYHSVNLTNTSKE